MAETDREETPEERRARWRSIAIGGKRPDTRRPADAQAIRPMQQPVWEKGTVKDHRGVPYINAKTLHPITVKQFQNHRGHFESQIRDLRNRPPRPD